MTMWKRVMEELEAATEMQFGIKGYECVNNFFLWNANLSLKKKKMPKRHFNSFREEKNSS